MRNKLRRALTMLALCAVLTGSLAVPASAAAFQDVPAGHWAADSIRRCVAQGYFNGQSETRFGLGQSMSRGAFAVVLCRFFGWETAAPAARTYSDVPTDAWYAGAVEAAYRHGAFTDQRTVFRPNDPITREELAVTLLRALGYGSLAGLAQDLTSPFTDVTTNAGYLTMAHDMGLMSGTGPSAFSPAGTASREQVAVILMRLYDQLYSKQPELIGVVSSASDLTGLDIAALPAARAFSGAIKPLMEPETVTKLCSAARSAGAEAFLYLECGAAALSRTPTQLAALIAEAAVSGGYDGLLLSVPGVTAQKRTELTRLVRAVDQQLNGLPLYLMVESPARSGQASDGYQYETLASLADRLLLKAPVIQEVSPSFTTAPVDPLEEVYYALATVSEQVGADKLGLMLDSELSCWTEGVRTPLSEEELNELLAAKTTQTYGSDRYACAYLTGKNEQGKSLTVWYLMEEDVAARVHLAVSLGVGQVCVSDWDVATEAFLAGLR